MPLRHARAPDRAPDWVGATTNRDHFAGIRKMVAGVFARRIKSDLCLLNRTMEIRPYRAPDWVEREMTGEKILAAWILRAEVEWVRAEMEEDRDRCHAWR